ncbi:MAG: VanZ family protein, partial [Bacteroidota bacterium]
MKIFFRNNYPWILWGLFILVLVCLPGDKIPKVPKLIDLFEPDKLVHLVMFALLTWWMIVGLRKQFGLMISQTDLVFYILLAVTLYGGGTELIQYYWIPGRICSLPDFIANEIGCFAGFFVHHRFRRFSWQAWQAR